MEELTCCTRLANPRFAMQKEDQATPFSFDKISRPQISGNLLIVLILPHVAFSECF